MKAVRRTLCLAAMLLPAGAAGAESLCDPNLPQESKSPVGYHMRGDRCEGIYAQQVSAISVEVRSLIAGFGPFDPAKDSELVLAWTAPPGGARNVRLRAFSFKPLTYYRMDTAVPAAQGAYRWPTDVLASVALGRAELGLLAWVELPGPAGAPREVHLPLRGGAAAVPETGYEVSLIPSVRLAEVRLTVSRLDADRKVTTVLRRDEELGYGYYPSNTPTVFSLGKLGPAGFYRLTIKAIPKGGLSAEQDIDLYHPGD